MIAKAGKPVARLIAFTHPVLPRTPGTLQGRVRISANFDAPLPPELAEAIGVKP